MSAVASAEEPWHRCALQVYMGYVENAATINQRDTYQELRMGSEAEAGIGFTMVMNPCFDLEFALAQLRASGTQRNAPGSGNENNSLDIKLKQTKLYITGKLRHNQNKGLFVPWIGTGINASMIQSREQEWILVTGGYIHNPEKTKASTAFGLHVAAGIDIYPVKTSALALAAEARYQMNAVIGGPFEGNLDSFAFLLGIKWDFWPTTQISYQPSTLSYQ